MANPTVIKLQDGNIMPQLGLGVWKAGNEEVITAIHKALEVGYRSIDTAAAYKMKRASARLSKARGSRAAICLSPPSCGMTIRLALRKRCRRASTS